MKRACNDKNQNNNKQYQINDDRKEMPEKPVPCTKSTKFNTNEIKNM